MCRSISHNFRWHGSLVMWSQSPKLSHTFPAPSLRPGIWNLKNQRGTDLQMSRQILLLPTHPSASSVNSKQCQPATEGFAPRHTMANISHYFKCHWCRHANVYKALMPYNGISWQSVLNSLFYSQFLVTCHRHFFYSDFKSLYSTICLFNLPCRMIITIKSITQSHWVKGTFLKNGLHFKLYILNIIYHPHEHQIYNYFTSTKVKRCHANFRLQKLLLRRLQKNE